jgi:cytoskeletal protein CcmA (bactofilin family)
MMQDISDKFSGDLSIADHVLITGMVTGSIRVSGGGSLDLRGMCCRDLIIDQGGRAVVRGMVCGDVLNGGTVEVFGMVNGALKDVDGGESHVDAKAVVGRR